MKYHLGQIGTLVLKNVLLFVSAMVILCILLSFVPDSTAGRPSSRILNYLKIAFTFDFGMSISNAGFSVVEVVTDRSLKTLYLIAGTLVLTIFIAVPLGVLGAFKSDSKLLELIIKPFYLFSSLPVLIWGLIIWVIVLAGFNKILIYKDLESATMLESLVIVGSPIVALSIGDGMLYDVFKRIRDEINSLIHQSWIKALKSRGRKISGHVARGLVEPLTISLTSKLTYLISGAIIVEFIFDWKGLGMLIFETIMTSGQKDYPLLIASVLVIIILVVFSSIIRDLIHTWLNPHMKELSR